MNNHDRDEATMLGGVLVLAVIVILVYNLSPVSAWGVTPNSKPLHSEVSTMNTSINLTSFQPILMFILGFAVMGLLDRMRSVWRNH